MKPLNIPFDDFDLDGFLNAYLEFRARMITQGDYSADHEIVYIDDDGVAPDGLEPTLPALCEAIDDGIKLFLDFHTRNDGENIHCVDGTTTEIPDYTDEDGNEDPNWRSYYLELPDEMCNYGYLVDLESGHLHIAPALLESHGCPSPGETVDEVEDCVSLDDQMDAFCRKFIKGKQS